MSFADPEPVIDTAAGHTNQGFRDDVLAGLSRPQKAVPCRWFYDSTGSRLFEELTRLPDYYLTRVESEILASRGQDIAALTGRGRAVVEFGSGSSHKTRHLLRAVDCFSPAAGPRWRSGSMLPKAMRWCWRRQASPA